jgi:hypothetical protein
MQKSSFISHLATVSTSEKNFTVHTLKIYQKLFDTAVNQPGSPAVSESQFSTTRSSLTFSFDAAYFEITRMCE